MEALAIAESQTLPAHLENGTLLFMNRLGVCKVDTLYTRQDDEALDQSHAEALLHLLDFELSDCTATLWQCLVWLLLQGLLWRVIALAGLRFGHRSKKV